MVKKSFAGGAAILMAAGFTVRILGFVYRIYLSNLIGAEGMGLFQLIMPVYSLVILTLTAGISIAVSKLVAAELAAGHIINLRRITSCALGIVISAGFAASAFMYIFIDTLTNVILKDSRTYYSILYLIPCIPVIAAASALKGYFYGIQNVVPTAISQIIEQLVRISLVVLMSTYFLNAGLEYACALATVGMASGEIANLSVLALVYKFRKEKAQIWARNKGPARKRHIIKSLMVISLPISFNRFTTSLLSAIELILIPDRLLSGGMDYTTSMEEFGRLAGMAMPLLFFPSLVTSSLATTLVPAIAEALSKKNYKLIDLRISKSIQFTFVLSFIFTVVFLQFPNEISNLIYKRERIGWMLHLLSFSCIFMYLQQTLLGILNGLGKQAVSLRNSIIGSVIRISFVYFFIPPYGIKGYIWGIIISSGCICILNFITVIKTTYMPVNLGNWILKPAAAGIILLLIGRFILHFFEIFNLGNSITIILSIVGNIAAAIFLMIFFGALDRNEVLRFLRIRK